MDTNHRFKRWSKLRFAIIYPFGLFVAIFSNCDDASIRASLGFIITGILIRLWANGYAIKMDKLTTSGPYRFVRHPLYVGTMLIAAGFVIMLKTYIAGTLFIFFMVASYYRTVKKEELMLEEKFKGDYLNYKKKIPAILPTLSPYTQGEKWRFSFKRLLKSKEYKTTIWMIIVVIAFHLKSEFLVEHEKIDAKILTLIIVAFMLGISDLISEIVKIRIKHAALRKS